MSTYITKYVRAKSDETNFQNHGFHFGVLRGSFLLTCRVVVYTVLLKTGPQCYQKKNQYFSRCKTKKFRQMTESRTAHCKLTRKNVHQPNISLTKHQIWQHPSNIHFVLLHKKKLVNSQTTFNGRIEDLFLAKPHAPLQENIKPQQHSNRAQAHLWHPMPTLMHSLYVISSLSPSLTC